MLCAGGAVAETARTWSRLCDAPCEFADPVMHPDVLRTIGAEPHCPIVDLQSLSIAAVDLQGTGGTDFLVRLACSAPAERVENYVVLDLDVGLRVVGVLVGDVLRAGPRGPGGVRALRLVERRKGLHVSVLSWKGSTTA